jgi:acylphosphatase
VKRIYAEVSGRVQGVGFRYFCKSLAETLGVSGWVRNLPGGNVELEAQAGPEELEEFLRKIRQGAPGSLVKNVATRDIPHEKEEGEFAIRF